VASGRGDGKRQCAAGEEFGASSGLRRSHGWTFGGGSRLHKVTLPDNTASVSIPDGWKFNTKVSGGGTIVLEGPHGGGEGIVLNTAYSGQDPTNPGFQRARQGGFRPPPNVVFHPHNGDLVKAFPDLYLRLGRSIGWHPTDLQIDRSETMPSPQSERCVHATGHVNNFGSGMMELNEMLCTVGFDPNTGQYRFTAFFSLLPNAVADQDRATAAAIMSSFKWDEALVRARSDAEMAPSSPRCARAGKPSRTRCCGITNKLWVN